MKTMMNRKQLYQDAIEDVALEISIAKGWRERIFRLQPDESLRISAADGDALPLYIRDTVIQNDLTFFVRCAERCDEPHDEHLTVFAFYAEEFPDICRYSFNNPDVQ